jgi:hypothetical protein
MQVPGFRPLTKRQLQHARDKCDEKREKRKMTPKMAPNEEQVRLRNEEKEQARLRNEETRKERQRKEEERERERQRNEEEKAAKKAKGSNSSSFENNLRRLADERARPGAIVPKGLFFGPVGEELGDKVGRCCAPRSSSARVHGSSGNVLRRFSKQCSSSPKTPSTT